MLRGGELEGMSTKRVLFIVALAGLSIIGVGIGISSNDDDIGGKSSSFSSDKENGNIFIVDEADIIEPKNSEVYEDTVNYETSPNLHPAVNYNTGDYIAGLDGVVYAGHVKGNGESPGTLVFNDKGVELYFSGNEFTRSVTIQNKTFVVNALLSDWQQISVAEVIE